MENKTSKYFKYAIGEIVLVVVGILIAVQINSYVEKKQLKKNNKILLNKMHTELKLNKERLYFLAFKDIKNKNDIRYISIEKAVKNAKELMDRTYKGLTKEDLDFILNTRFGAGGSYLNLHNSIYEELINTGKLYTLGSDNLITAIKNYYKRCEREDLYNRANTKIMREGYKFLEKGLTKIRLDYSLDSLNFDINNYPWYFDKSSSTYQDMQLGISKIAGGQSSNLYKMNELISYTDSLAVVIKKELEIL
jgi:hypothetical protein